MLKGWRIVIATAIVSAVMLGLMGTIEGITEASIRMAVRGTARVSCLLFLMAFVAAPLHRLWATDFSQWLVKNRRFLGISMAVSHTYHAIVLVGLHIITQGKHPTILPLALLGYVFLIAMTITSFAVPAKAIGRRAWRILHTAGMHFFWLAFVGEFAVKATKSWLYFGLTVMVLLVMAIRLWPQDKRRAVANS